MTSEKRRAANRLNALKSTGAKTEEGRRRSALNALRHGLTAPVDLSPLALHLPELERMLVLEGIEPSQARDLALRILDYERNVGHQRRQFGLEPSGPPGQSRVAGASSQSPAEKVDSLQAMIDYGLSGFKSPIDGPIKRIEKLLASLERKEATDQNRELRNADRHLRRSANHLIKQLRVLSAPSV